MTPALHHVAQVLRADPAARLLLCAPQNYSADLLASALGAAGVPPRELLRLNDPRRPPNQVLLDSPALPLFHTYLLYLTSASACRPPNQARRPCYATIACTV